MGAPEFTPTPDADDLRIWGGKEPYDPDLPDLEQLALSAITSLFAEDVTGTADCLERLAGRTGRALFASCYGWAVVAGKMAGEGVSGDGRFYVEVEEVREGKASDITSDEAQAAAAFLAAGANHDGEGASRMWRDLSVPECVKLSMTMLQMVVAILKHKDAER